jgi:cytochrome b561
MQDQDHKLDWPWPTRLLHLLVALAVIHQLGISLVMRAPEAGQPGDMYYELHEKAGLATFVVVFVYWLWIGFRQSRRGVGVLFPWFSRSKRSAVFADLRFHIASVAQLKLPALKEQPLASAVHGLGLLIVTIMAGTGAIAWSGLLSGSTTRSLWQVHAASGNVMWVYLIGHASFALLHEFAGERLLARVFAFRFRA